MPDPRSALVVGHRRDIEGLRAIAVLAVLLYHAGVPGLAGGYVGVDVFFAVSGYLMTALLVTERWSAGRISLRAFYARRARRLLPAAVTVLLATLAASRYVLSPLAFERAASDIAAAGGYVVNLRFAREATDYLGSDIGASPVLHYWSLAVEEQFYLVWPILLGVALGRSGRRRGPVVLLTLIAIASFALAVVWTAKVQPWGFFSLPSRAWEFAVGGLAAFWVPARRSVWSTLLGWCGLAFVIASVVSFDETTRFPGPMAAIPVIGTVMVLAAGGRGPARMLSAEPLQWIGRRSYGIYLWHWPPLVLLPVLLDRELRLVESLAVLAGAVAVAALALVVIEDPVRFARVFRGAPWRSAVLGLALTTAAVATPWWVRTTIDTTGSGAAASVDNLVTDNTAAGESVDDNPPTEGTVGREPRRLLIQNPTAPTPVPSNLVPSLADVGDDEVAELYSSGCHLDQLSIEPKLPCEFGRLDSDLTVVLFGDSHMAQWFPAFEPLAEDLDLRVVSLTKSACPSADKQVYNTLYGRPYDECDMWRDAAIDVIVGLRPDVVVLGNYPGGDVDVQARALVSTVERLAPSGAEVVVMGPTPVPPSNVPDCVSAELADTRPCDLVRTTAVSGSRAATERNAVVAVGARYLESSDWFCGPTVCPAVLGEYLVYRDGSHITTPYMAWLAPVLGSMWADLGLPIGSSASSAS